MVMRVAWEHDRKMHSANAGLCMNFSTDVKLTVLSKARARISSAMTVRSLPADTGPPAV
jgi:hypothetical protein